MNFVDAANTLLPSPLCLYDYWVALALMAAIHWLTHSTRLQPDLDIFRSLVHLRATTGLAPPHPTFAFAPSALPAVTVQPVPWGWMLLPWNNAVIGWRAGPIPDAGWMDADWMDWLDC